LEEREVVHRPRGFWGRAKEPVPNVRNRADPAALEKCGAAPV
jgi:hypothetical protein